MNGFVRIKVILSERIIFSSEGRTRTSLFFFITTLFGLHNSSLIALSGRRSLDEFQLDENLLFRTEWKSGETKWDWVKSQYFIKRRPLVKQKILFLDCPSERGGRWDLSEREENWKLKNYIERNKLHEISRNRTRIPVETVSSIYKLAVSHEHTANVYDACKYLLICELNSPFLLKFLFLDISYKVYSSQCSVFLRIELNFPFSSYTVYYGVRSL